MMAKSFDDILTENFERPTVTPPVRVLSELASSLCKKVQYKIIFDVVSEVEGDRAIHSLRAGLRQLDYVLELVTVSHDILQLYPARLSGTLVHETIEAQSEDDLFEMLAKVFRDANSQEIIGTLLAQAK